MQLSWIRTGPGERSRTHAKNKQKQTHTKKTEPGKLNPFGMNPTLEDEVQHRRSALTPFFVFNSFSEIKNRSLL